MSIANIVIGPIIIAIIFGFIVGSRVHLNLGNSFKFTASGILALIIGVLIMSYGLGQFPVYNDVPIATTFLGAVIGVLIGSALLGGRAKGDH
ncbi:MAG: energy-converting hydrogenase B subunit J [Methanobrevibacter sp.]|uniref:energy-converting hydrogenase B subunit J n=1 Tax=Methanobrevibacter sp. TaxID=66852 RepID=UPI0025FD8582|nr:energy-converting hydrogenase B subunit J [Methanobrevibacter sp.]MBQ6138207.1 energy-converting hydrogenase B subunit J [Methanobrevibacter sp.]